MKRWGFWSTDKCPCCLTHSEKDTRHMFKCKQQEMCEYRNKIFTEVYVKLDELETAPHILEILVSSLQGDLSGRIYESKDINKLINRLKVIDQFNLLNGFIPVDLCALQHRYYMEQGLSRQ